MLAAGRAILDPVMKESGEHMSSWKNIGAVLYLCAVCALVTPMSACEEKSATEKLSDAMDDAKESLESQDGR